MIIYPAIDIKDGKCVRLKQGRADESTIFYQDPLNAAKAWIEKGAQALHIVDLDGAFNGRPNNMDKISEIKNYSEIFVQMGGGIRDKLIIDNIFSNNIDRIILGTAAMNNIELVKWAVDKYGERIAVSVDTLDKKVAYDGWTGVSEIHLLDFLKEMIDVGINTFIYTDISKDGMLAGPDISGIEQINEKFDVKVIASGGITTIEDIKTLKKMGTYGAIIGKALYSGNIALEEALEVASCY